MSEASKQENKKFVEEATAEDGRAFARPSKTPAWTTAAFKVGEEAVLEDPDDEPDCDVTIEKSRRSELGNWQYKVRSKATNKLVRKGEWFPETSLSRA